MRNRFSARLREHWLELTVLLFFAIAMHLPLIGELYRNGVYLIPEKAGQFGDFVGGYIGTLFTLFSVLLIYWTLKHQRASSSEEKFEGRYFEMIKMHRDNAAELELEDASGRKIFVSLIGELRAIYSVAKETAASLDLEFSNKELMGICYTVLLFGTGPNSIRMLFGALSDVDEKFLKHVNGLLEYSSKWPEMQDDSQTGKYFFDGHQARLGHYYRHLYQTICFVDKQEFSDEVKYDYVRTIRAQLTTHEQAMLLVNSLASVGRKWRNNGRNEPNDLIAKYRLVKNIPRGFFALGELDLEELFDQGYFEWQDAEATSSPKLPGVKLNG